MKALVIQPGTRGARIVNRAEPALAGESDVKLRVLRVGICGTDREELAGGRAQAPRGAGADRNELVIGHEMFGRVVGVGAAVRRVKLNDLAVFTVRRGCGACANCGMHRSDMCSTGNYRERGIQGADGYQTEFVVDGDANIVRVPSDLAAVGVLLEPLSIVEKAIAETLRLQSQRDPEAAVTPAWLAGRRCLVAGLGPVGLLAAMVLILRGGEVYGLDVVDAAGARAQWLAKIGGSYLDGRTAAGRQAAIAGSMDLILDASGAAALEFNLLDALARNGIYVLTGIPGGDHPLELPAAELVRQLVLGNQIMLGSVNAARGHFQMAVEDLAQAQLRWGGQVGHLITHRQTPEQFVAAVAEHAQHPTAAPSDRIKEVVEWA